MKPSRLAQLWIAAAMMIAALAPWSDQAQAQGARGTGSRHEPMQDERAQRQAPASAEWMRRAAPHEEMSRRTTMSVEERRQLRRDVHDAGRELYRHPRSQPTKAREAGRPGAE